MKRVLYSILILFFFSCTNASKNEASPTLDVSENEKTVEEIEETTEAFTYQNLSKQKLQEFYDLLLLQKNHPEFNEDISIQLKGISEKNINVPKTATQVSVKEIKQLKENEVISDSITKVFFEYKLDFNGVTKIDTITAIVITKQVLINDEQQIFTKLKFVKN